MRIMFRTQATVSNVDECFAAGVLGLTSPALPAQPSTEPVPGDYRIVDSKVDRGTFTGWRLFHTTC